MDAEKAKISELEKKISEKLAAQNDEGVDRYALAQEVAGLKAELAQAKTQHDFIADALEPIAEGGEGDAGSGEGDAAGGDGGEGDAGDEGAPEVPAPVAPEVPAVGDGDAGDGGDGGAAGAHVPATLAASAAGSEASPTAHGTNRPTIALTAAASIGGIGGGEQVDRAGLQALLAGAHQAAHGEGGGRLLSINRWDGDPDIVSEANSAIANTRIIREAQRAHAKGEGKRGLALVAGACFCGPDDIFPDLGLTGDRGRPVAGLFPSIPLSGGFSFFRDLTIDPDSGSVGVWSCDDQDNVDPDDPDTWKSCSELDCFTQESSYPYMVKACTTVQRTHRWAHPEQVDTWIEKLRLEYDRVAEKQLLSIIETDAGTPLTVGTGNMAAYGYVAQLDYALGSLAFSLGYQFRSDALAGHVVITPRGMLEAMLADERLRGFPSNLTSVGAIRSHFEQGYGVRLVERMDEPTGALSTDAAATVTALNAGGAIDTTGCPLLPPLFRLHIVRPDQWVHGEGVMVGADWFVDNAMLRQNKLQFFWENVETLVRTGVEKAYVLDVNGRIAGTYADLSAAPDCA